MGVGHQHRVDAARMERQGGVVDLIPALLQTAVHQDLLPVDLQTMAAAGDTLVSAVKLSFMAETPFHKLYRRSIPQFPGLYNRKTTPLSAVSGKLFTEFLLH